MDYFETLPFGVLICIVKHLCPSSIDLFDSVAVKELQKARLISRKLRIVVTPILFRNLVWDLKFLQQTDIHRIIEFVRQNPSLSRYVHRLQIRVPPSISAWEIDDLIATQRFLQDLGTSQGKEFSVVDVAHFHELMVAPLQKWKENAEDDIMVVDRNLKKVFQETFQLLRNLAHIETAVSTYYYEYLGMASQRIAEEMQIFVEDYSHNSMFSESAALTNAFALIPLCAPTKVKSYKFCQVPLMEDLPTWTHLPTHIQRLDIEFRIPHDYRNSGEGQELLRIAVVQWRRQLKSLTHLKYLCLSLCGSWDDINSLTLQRNYPFYVDDLLAAASLASAKDIVDGGAFPRLETFSLKNVPVRSINLHNFLYKHRSTLENIFLRRVSLDMSPDQDMDWAQIATMLGEEVYGLKEVEFWRLGMHWVAWINEEGKVVEYEGMGRDDGEEKPEGWKRVLLHQLLDLEDAEALYDLAESSGSDI